MSRLVFALMCALCLGGCARDLPQALHPTPFRAEGATIVGLEIATTRVPSTNAPDFTDLRSRKVSYQTISVSIPPLHKPGNIEWPARYPGLPGEHFVTTANEWQSAKSFVASVEKRLPPSGEVLLFIHGYNTNQEEAVFRLAQMVSDAKIPMAPVAFTWPSRGDITDYVTDRESALAARTHLYDTLLLLARSPKVKRINLFAHSMGAMLGVEMLVQARLRGNAEIGGKLDAVVLASPDIDVDVFLSQMEIVGKRKSPTIILTAKNDRALMLSRRIAGDVTRLGAATVRSPATVAAMQKYGLIFIDLTNLETEDATNHSKFANSPVFLQQLGSVLSNGLTREGNRFGSFVVDTAGTIFDTPSSILRRVVPQ